MQQMNGLRGALTRFLSSEVLIRLPGTVTYQRQSALLSAWCPLQVTRWDMSTLGRPIRHSETGQMWSLTQKRYRWRPKLIRAPPTKPLSFDYSGDQTLSIGSVNLNGPKLGFENIEELQNANENVKKIFSLEFGTHLSVMNKLVDNLMEKVKDHPLDLQSLEVTIATDTLKIRNEIKHCLQFRNDKINKARLIKRIFKRRNMLKELKSMDIEKFDWIVNELKIHYFEPETKYDLRKLSKKGVRKKIARDAAIGLKKEKMEEFKKKLDQERVVFEKYKDTELGKIEVELRELGIDAMTTLKETLDAMNLGDLLPKPEPRIKRRRVLLHKKFELYGERKKVMDDEILKNYGFLTEKEMPLLP